MSTTPMDQETALALIAQLASSAGLEVSFVGQQQEAEKPKEEKKARKAKKLPKALKPGEAEKMLSCLNTRYPTSLRDRCIFELMFRSGLRVSEPLNLMVEDVDLENGYVNVQQSKNKKDRTVPIDDGAIEWLKKWKAIRPESDYFFSTLQGGKIDTRQIREKCYRLSKKSGVYLRDGQELKKVHPHTFRHTCFTECLEEGLNVREIQELAGHSSLSTTAVYLSVRPEKLKEKMQARGKGKDK